MAAPFGTLCVALAGLLGGGALIAAGNPLAGALMCVIGVLFVALTALEIRGEGEGRSLEQDRLRKELLARLDGTQHG